MRGNCKLFRVKKEHIKIVQNVSSFRELEQAFEEGYVFLKEKNIVYMINTTVSKKTFTINKVNVEIVGEE